MISLEPDNGRRGVPGYPAREPFSVGSAGKTFTRSPTLSVLEAGHRILKIQNLRASAILPTGK